MSADIGAPLAAALSHALRALLPSPDETLLLRACLLRDARGRDAWEQFKRDHGDLTELFRTDKGELKRLGPLLSQGLNASGADADARLWTVLRTGRMREGLRAKLCQEILRDSLNALREAKVTSTVFRGAVAAELLYDDPALRHSHDIDLLIDSHEHDAATVALQAVGFTRDNPSPTEGGRQPIASLTHKTSLPIRLHSSLFELKAYGMPARVVSTRAVRATLSSVAARVLSPEDMLLQILVHATYTPTRYTLQWACDAYLFVAKYPAINWNAFIQLCAQLRVSLPVSVMLNFLLTQLDVAIPHSVIETINMNAVNATPFERDLALFGARTGAKSGLSALFASVRSMRERVQLAMWLLKPSAEYVTWAEQSATARHGGGLAGRLARYALRT